MITTLLLWIIIFFTLIVYGRFCLKGIGIWVKKPMEKIHPVFSLLAGLCGITFIADLVSFFAPIDKIFCLVISGGAVLLLVIEGLKNHPWSNFSIKKPTLIQSLVILTGGLMGFIILDLSSRAPANPDTAIYHAQAIHWIETYRAVLGLGNLHSRLAYNSNWLVSNAVFDYAWFNGLPFHALPGLLALVCLFYFLGGLWQIADHHWTPAAWIKTLIIPVFFLVSPSEVSSPGTDLPVVLIVWVILCESLEQVWTANANQEGKQLLLGSLAVFAMTIKLSVLPLLILPAFMAVFYLLKKNPAWVFKISLLGTLILGVWLARNVILSGYLVYPFPQVDLFAVDWKIPHGDAEAEVNSITNWARHIWVGSDQHNYSLPLQEWVPLWFTAETLNHKILAGLAGLALLLYPLLLLFKTTRTWLLKMDFAQYGFVLGTSCAGCLFWFLSAPDFRFGYGFVTFTILAALFPVFKWISSLKREYLKIVPYLLGVGLLLFQCGFYGLSLRAGTFSQRVINPEPYLTAPTGTCQFGNFSTWCAQLYDQCWYNPFPCVPRGLPSVEMRDTSYINGFRDTSLGQ